MRNKKLIIALLSVLAVVLIASITTIGVIKIKDTHIVKKYNDAIATAQKYLNNEDYDNAIIKFKEAIKIDDKEETAYANLGVIYINLNNMQDALNILTIGYEKTNSDTIKSLIDVYFKENTLMANNDTQENKENKKSNVITLNRSFVGQLSSYTCAKYAANYGNPTMKSDGLKYELSYGNIAAKFTYYDVDNDKVIDSVMDKPYENKMPVEISVSDLSQIFTGMEESISFGRLQELSLSELKCEEIKDEYYVTFRFSGCYFQIKSTERGDITSKDAKNVIKPLNRQASENEKYILKGTVIDAMTGKGVDNAEIYVRKYGDRTGGVLAETRSGSDGSYQIELEADSYTVQIVKEGFIEEFFDATVNKSDYTQGNFTISPNIAEGEVRIVLTWGSFPRDLDSHLEGRTDKGDVLHVYFGNKIFDAAELDVDEISGYGPETTTIHDLRGKYTFKVVDFGNTGTMSSSGAEVKVYLQGNAQPIVYNIGPGMHNVWNVFEIDHGRITEINQPGD